MIEAYRHDQQSIMNHDGVDQNGSDGDRVSDGDYNSSSSSNSNSNSSSSSSSSNSNSSSSSSSDDDSISQLLSQHKIPLSSFKAIRSTIEMIMHQNINHHSDDQNNINKHYHDHNHEHNNSHHHSHEEEEEDNNKVKYSIKHLSPLVSQLKLLLS